MKCRMGVPLLVSFFSVFYASDALPKDKIVTKSEVSGLVAIALDKEIGHYSGYSKCRFAARWSNQEIPKDYIKKYLHIELSSDVSPNSNVSAPAEYLKNNGVPEEAICAIHPTDERTQSTSIGFPIFNSNHTTAVMTVSESSECIALDSTGKKVPTSTGGSSLLVFEKRGRWKLIAREEISNWDGLPCSD